MKRKKLILHGGGCIKWSSLDSQLGSSKGTLAKYGDIFDCLFWGWQCYWHLGIEARAAAEHSMMYGTICPKKNYLA